MLLVQKWPLFALSFFRHYRPEKCLLWYSRTEKRFVEYKNKKFKKSKNWLFSKGVVPWFRSKNGHFSNVFFLGNKRKKNVFLIFWNGKTFFYNIKTRILKKTRKWHFSKGFNPCFWYKNGHFLHFLFLCIIGEENVFYDILEGENAFLGYKNKKFKKTKKWHLPKGLTNGFVPKIVIFRTLFFREYRPGKCLSWYSRMEKGLSRL